MTEAVVVGSGPNGLAGAVRLAEAGLRVTVLEAADRVGGGLRTSELTVPGLLHDDCSAFHPAFFASPYLSTLGLERHGLEFAHPEIQVGHPLDGGRAAFLHRSVAQTAAGLGAGGPSWERLFAPLVRDFPALVEDTFGPVLRVPHHPLRLARFGALASLPATVLGPRLGSVEARALFGGVAAHLIGRLDRPLSSAVGLMLAAASHVHGWPVARGGSQSIAAALVARLTELGGTVETGVRVETVAQLRGADVVLLDLAPGAVVDLLGEAMPHRVARSYRRFRHGPAAFKVDLAVADGVPWTHPDLARAGTVHLGGAFDEVAAAERDITSGRMPARPFVLLGQQYVADPSRSNGDVHPVWAYAHVPAGYDQDATEAVLGQVERFAPGFRDRVLAVHTRSPAELTAYNANYVGGDIGTGANGGLQIVLRPRPAANPYRTGVPGHYLCSAATPPGGGVHGMGGFHAAEAALRDLGINP